jgi:predicted Rossmann fold flavoprotein
MRDVSMLQCDIAIVGAGAAGMAAAIFAGRAAATRQLRIALIDGAPKPGAKILVSGGGRCNVTHQTVTPDDYFGGSRVLIRNVLRAFDERKTVEWMHGMGVDLKLEETGKYFPVTDKARTVLDALTRALRDAGAELIAGTRITSIAPAGEQFFLYTTTGIFATARRLIVATGGLSLPKSGSNGAGLEWLRKLGHTVVQTTPALAPLVLKHGASPGGRFADLSGVSFDCRIALRSPDGKTLAAETGSALFTHFGLSGPAPMNLSRHIAQWRLGNPSAPPAVTIGHSRFERTEQADAWLRAAASPRRMTANVLAEVFPERLADVLAHGFGRLADLTREQRTRLARRMAQLPVDVTGDRGYEFAETTAGGVDLREIDVRTMQSRIVPGLFICGEMLDVDGRIGGFCFQWAWATGYLAGRGAVASLAPATR